MELCAALQPVSLRLSPCRSVKRQAEHPVTRQRMLIYKPLLHDSRTGGDQEGVPADGQDLASGQAPRQPGGGQGQVPGGATVPRLAFALLPMRGVSDVVSQVRPT